jgi:peptidoglycan hydrolase-like protein with peptidoglycan-binding domain
VTESELTKAEQETLYKAGYYLGRVDGVDGPKTQEARKAWVRYQIGLTPAAVGLVASSDTRPTAANATVIPSALTLPDTTAPFAAMTSTERAEMFGGYKWESVIGDNIRIIGDWESRNVVSVYIPELDGKPLYQVGGTRFSGNIRVHKLVAKQWSAFFAAVGALGLTDRIVTFDGAFNARKIRGGSTLSNHAYGTAIDINANWNGLGRTPAGLGATGCLRKLVPIAHKFGIYWGGNFASRPDGMHFEIAKVLDL